MVAAQDAKIMEAPQTKVCTVCNQEQPISNFYVEHKTRADGTAYDLVRSKCKVCWKEGRRPRSRAQRPQAVNADGRRAGKPSNTSASGYHFDKHTLNRLTRIARVLAREGRRTVDAVNDVDNSTLAAAGMYVGDIQVLRKAVSTRDEDLCHFIFSAPLLSPKPDVVMDLPVQAEPIGEVVEPEPPLDTGFNMERVTALSGLVPPPPDDLRRDVEVLVKPTNGAGVGLSERVARGDFVPLGARSVLTDSELESAAEMVVQSRTRIRDLQAEVQRLNDELNAAIDRLRGADDDRRAALSLLRRA